MSKFRFSASSGQEAVLKRRLRSLINRLGDDDGTDLDTLLGIYTDMRETYEQLFNCSPEGVPMNYDRPPKS